MQKEILSAYMDGNDVKDSFTETLCNNPELQKKWASYHTIRSVMRNEDLLLGTDFSVKMATLIAQEPIISMPKVQKKTRNLLLKLKAWSSPLMQVGIAASVCLVAIFSVNLINSKQEIAYTEPSTLQTLPFSNSIQQVSYNAPAQIQPTSEQLEQQQRRLNALIQNHELQRRVNAGDTNVEGSNDSLQQPQVTPQK